MIFAATERWLKRWCTPVAFCVPDLGKLKMQRRGCTLDVVLLGPLSQDTEEGKAGEAHHGADEGGADDEEGDEGGADDEEGDVEQPPPPKKAARVRKVAKRQVKTRKGRNAAVVSRRGGRPAVMTGRRLKEYNAFRSFT